MVLGAGCEAGHRLGDGDRAAARAHRLGDRPRAVRGRRPELEPGGRRATDGVDGSGEGDGEPGERRGAGRRERPGARPEAPDLPVRRAGVASRGDAVVVGRSRLEAADRRPLGRGAAREACVDVARSVAEPRRGAVLEPRDRAAAPRVDAAADARRRRRDGVRSSGGDGGSAVRAEADVAARRRPDVVRGHEAEVVGHARGEAADPDGDADRRHACAGRARLGAVSVAARRPVLDPPPRRASVRIDRASEVRRTGADEGGGAGPHLGRSARGERHAGAAARAVVVGGDDAVVVGDAGREPGQLVRDVDGRGPVPRAAGVAAGAVGAGRPVLDAPGRALATGIDGAADDRAPRADRGGGSRRGRRRACAGRDGGHERGECGGDDGESTAHCTLESPPVALGPHGQRVRSR